MINLYLNEDHSFLNFEICHFIHYFQIILQYYELTSLNQNQMEQDYFLNLIKSSLNYYQPLFQYPIFSPLFPTQIQVFSLFYR